MEMLAVRPLPFAIRALRRVLLVGLLFLLAARPGWAEARWALVLGNSSYRSDVIPDLANTVNDARTMSASLNDMGFSVYYLEDGTKAQIADMIETIAVEQGDATLELFYFAGHGVQLEGENFALPVDIEPGKGTFLRDQGVSVNAVIRRLNAFGTQNLVVILDSCRNSPFSDESAIGTGLALVDAPENTIIAYSTAPGAVALDGAGANSPFTAALASVLDGPEQDIRDVLRLVRARVRLATGGAQTPWFIDNSRNEIVIQPRRATEAAILRDAVRDRDISLATTAWNTIVTSADPRDFEEFATLFPTDQLAPIAKRQLQLIGPDGPPGFPLMDLGATGSDVANSLMSVVTVCDILATGV